MRTNYSTLKIAGVGLIAILLAACGSEQQSDLQKLKADLDSLKLVRSSVEEQILAVEEQIDLMDTTIENALVTSYETDKGTFKHYFEVYGNVETDKAATLYPESGGVITSIRVEEGQNVSKGTVIVTIDTDLIDKNIAELETSLDLANTLFEKQKRLWDQNIGSEVQYLEAKNRKESLENSLATLQEQRNKSTVRAPFSGVIDKIFPKEGEMAGMQMPVARLISLEGLYITADVTERYVNDIAAGDSVWALFNRTDTIAGVISRVGKYINPNNRSFEIKVKLNSEGAGLRPNSLVALKINDYTQQEAITIPSSLIMQDGQGADYVYVIRKDEHQRSVASKRSVKTMMSYEGKTMVSEGLKKGDLLIDKGSRSVRDGDLIEVTTI